MTEQEILERLKNSVRKAIYLTAAQESGTLLKLGGIPDVPENFQWPLYNGRPLSFLAQIDLRLIPFWLTEDNAVNSGMLYFFYDNAEMPWGYDPADFGAWRVLFYPDATNLSPGDVPAELTEYKIFTEKRLEHRDIISYPNLTKLNIDFSECRKEFKPSLLEYVEKQKPDDPWHQLGGFPGAIQSDYMELECQFASNGIYLGNQQGYLDPRTEELTPGAAEWQLLLQLDSDDDTGMMWGDMGRLYFWIRTADFQKFDFSNVWMILQCC